ncbi:thiol-disulfide oxidoreductase DCC family protein [Kitasatospora kifunensis]|uniref:Putative DCC family thiol-disulfide oxidoreductase YuxK n=1 Tax=Kitasatospora kifunensis TaxID=58351 RepID=A0A7W7R3Y6_KITKI|nr:DCC1-like thiol-disulfide oxidoreductase family protein [Kitasatospora kifunensis]MBB4924977.1 putative DCC family thiol-disulfide oxidoreductase YuxK [Kitasatospora kifunensis]
MQTPTAPAPPPVGQLTVLHDPRCGLCRHLTTWLRGQPQLVPLRFLPVASYAARRHFPGLDHDASLGELTVVADTGEVWRGAAAFVACLWALTRYRELALRLSSPAGLPLARAAAFVASRYRTATGAGLLPPPGPPGPGDAAPEPGAQGRPGPGAALDPSWPPPCSESSCSGRG